MAVYERNGTFVTEWGGDILSAVPHGITIDAEDNVYVVDQFDHTVRKFSSDGRPLSVIGTPGLPSETGSHWEIKNHVERVRRTVGGPPFNHPTNLAIGPTGEIYVSDGYCNARIHQFTPQGELIRSWGEPGSGEGQFRLPHDVSVDDEERVLVADRENDRIQLFTLDGQYLETWPSQKPCAIEVRHGLIYVAETRLDSGTYSFTRGEIADLEWARVSIYDHRGRVVERFGPGRVWPDDASAPGHFTSAHGLAVDSQGDVYVAETTYTSAGRRGLVPDDCHTLQKFEFVESGGAA
ncbi:peptidyl-alpha-hydroxyglycine alpha-amidating lyase family protein [Rhodococcus koreensis]